MNTPVLILALSLSWFVAEGDIFVQCLKGVITSVMHPKFFVFVILASFNNLSHAIMHIKVS